MILHKNNRKQAGDFFKRIIDIGVDFKLQDVVTSNYLSLEEGKKWGRGVRST